MLRYALPLAAAFGLLVLLYPLVHNVALHAARLLGG
jgi:hypothetical protein